MTTFPIIKLYKEKTTIAKLLEESTGAELVVELGSGLKSRLFIKRDFGFVLVPLHKDQMTCLTCLMLAGTGLSAQRISG